MATFPSRYLFTTIEGFREALLAEGIESFLLDEAIDLAKCLPTDPQFTDKVLVAASLLELAGGGSVDDVSVTITGNGTNDLIFPEDIRGVLTIRSVYDGASVAIGHKETTGGPAVPFRHPDTGVALVVSAATGANGFAFEFVMPQGGIIDLTTTGAGGSTSVKVTARSIKSG